MSRALDVIIFGATGLTGRHTVSLISELSNTKYRQLTWGIAGRSKKKLKELLLQCEQKTATSLSDIPVITANAEDEKSLKEMARKAHIIINCCGPWLLHGEPVVKACVEEGTHHVDVSGEPHYMETMQLKYHALAQEKGVYVISACGVDSIPADLGVVFLQQKFKGTLNSVDTYMEIWEEGEPLPGPSANYATWQSLVHGFANSEQLNVLRRQLFPTSLPSFSHKLKFKTHPHRSEVVEGWAIPFPGADRSIVKRSQRCFYEKEAKRPVQIETYYVLKSKELVSTMDHSLWLLSKLATHPFGRSLLLKYPERFSNGLIGHESPSEEKSDNIRFSVTLHGEGWKGVLPNTNKDYTIPPDRTITAKVTGRNPGYGATCVCVVLAALTVITEPDKMPASGGVYPPGYAFARTSLIEQLKEHGVTFDILGEKDLYNSKY